MDDDNDYKVGFKRPPLHTRFKKGQSGNPKGRPRKIQDKLEEMAAKVFLNPVPIIEGGKQRKVPLMEAIMIRLAQKAANGDLKAITYVVERYGYLFDKRVANMQPVVTSSGSIPRDLLKEIMAELNDEV